VYLVQNKEQSTIFLVSILCQRLTQNALKPTKANENNTLADFQGL